MGAECENVKPDASSPDDKASQVRRMFDRIAPSYDFMNRAMTLGIDRLWRRKAVGLVARHGGTRILDVATGTGDLALQMARRIDGTEITGVDLSEGMIGIGREKVARAGMTDRISLMAADCLALPFADATFDAVTAAFGVRNFADLSAGMREMARGTRPGGMLCVIELSTPRGPVTGPLYRLYTRGIVPALGRLVSRDSNAYSYLPQSIAAVPQGREMCALLEASGWKSASHLPLTFGSCTIYLAYN